MIELLESRVAPAALNGQVLTYTDVDHDHVTITISKGTLTPSMFSFGDIFGVDGDTTRLQNLASINLSSAADVDDANITMRVVRGAGGDGLANVGAIDASNHGLGNVMIKGDLGRITLGGGPMSDLGLKSLTVASMGLYNHGNLACNLGASVGPIKVAGDLKDVMLTVGGPAGPLTIGGSLIRGSLLANSIGAVKIGHDIMGGDAQDSGSITDVGGGLVSLTVGGSIYGGSGTGSGSVSVRTKLGPMKITGDLVGGDGDGSGRLTVSTNFGTSCTLVSVTIGGSLIGGLGVSSGGIVAAAGPADMAAMGPVKIGHDVIGAGDGSANISAKNSIASVTIGGSLVGGEGIRSGRIGGEFPKIGPVKIAHDVVGGSGDQSGRIVTPNTIATVTIGGSMFGGHGNDSGNIVATGDVGAVRITGSVVGGFGTSSGQIFSGDVLTSVTIGGSLVGGDNPSSGSITGGLNDFTMGDTFSLGPVKIGGGLIGGKGTDTARIATDGPLKSVTVGGAVVGNGPGSGQFISGGDMGAVRIGGDLRGGSITDSEPDVTFTGYIQGQRIASIYIGGSIVAGIDSSDMGALGLSASIRAVNDIGPITVRGSILGNSTPDGTSLVIISARGQATPTATSDVAIKSLTVGGQVELANILAGYTPSLTAANPNAQIGAVSVGRDWAGSNLVAGVTNDAGNADPSDDNRSFGDNHDRFIGGAASSLSRIASITIRGHVIGGTAASHFGFVAHTIGSFRLGGLAIPVPPGSVTDLGLSNTSVVALNP